MQTEWQELPPPFTVLDSNPIEESDLVEESDPVEESIPIVENSAPRFETVPQIMYTLNLAQPESSVDLGWLIDPEGDSFTSAGYLDATGPFVQLVKRNDQEYYIIKIVDQDAAREGTFTPKVKVREGTDGRVTWIPISVKVIDSGPLTDDISQENSDVNESEFNYQDLEVTDT